MIPVVVASSTVACGGRRELPKSSGTMLPSLQLSLWRLLRVFMDAGVEGKSSVMIREVLGG